MYNSWKLYMPKPVSASSSCTVLMTNILDAVPEKALQTWSGVYHIPLSSCQRPYLLEIISQAFILQQSWSRQARAFSQLNYWLLSYNRPQGSQCLIPSTRHPRYVLSHLISDGLSWEIDLNSLFRQPPLKTSHSYSEMSKIAEIEEELTCGVSACPPKCSQCWHFQICNTLYSKPQEIDPCGHIFCKKCLDLWLSAHKTCPMCRNKVLSTQRNRTLANLTDILRKNDAEVRPILEPNPVPTEHTLWC